MKKSGLLVWLVLGRRLLGSLWPPVLVAAFVAGCGAQSVPSPANPPKTAPNPQVQVTGAETWSLASGDTEVLETALLRFTNGEAMLVVKVSCATPGPTEKPLAREVAEYAVQHEYLKKAEASRSLLRASKLGNRIGVALVGADGKSGYRFNFSLDELGHHDQAAETQQPTEASADITKQRRSSEE